MVLYLLSYGFLRIFGFFVHREFYLNWAAEDFLAQYRPKAPDPELITCSSLRNEIRFGKNGANFWSCTLRTGKKNVGVESGSLCF